MIEMNGTKFYPKVSIIVLNYYGGNIVKECVESILDTDYPNFELIFVDNGSKDGSLEAIKKEFGYNSRIKIIANNQNVGVTRGYNEGIVNADGKYIAIMNYDVKVKKDWLRPLVNIMENDKSIGGVQPKCLSWDEPRRIDHCGIVMDILGFTYDRGRYLHGIREIDKGQYGKIEEIFGAGCVTSIWRKEVLLEVKGFDPYFFFGYEDADLSWRIRLRGYKILFVPLSIVYHKRSTGSGVGSKLYGILLWQIWYRYNFCKNHLTMLIKNLNISSLLLVLFFVSLIYIMGMILSPFIYWKNKKNLLYSAYSLTLMRAVPKAFITVIFKNIRYIIKQRYVIQKSRKISDKQILKHVRKKSALTFLKIW